MRAALSALSAAALLFGAATAFAAPASITVSVGPELQKKFDKTYGVKEAELLKDDLRASVEKALAKTGAHDGATIQLTLVDVKPNRPTFKQLGDTPGLSMQSFGIGGATIEGTVTSANGAATPVAYKWYETDIREIVAHWVWTDAEFAFDRFARRLATGGELAKR
jgi:hypothetical protein